MKIDLEVIEITQESMESMIYEIRGQKVMLDFDLAKIYGYETKYLNRQVQRNIEKFPSEFMFQLNNVETQKISRCQNVTTIQQVGIKGGRVYYPYAFTEQGIYMLMTVLKGELATKQSIALIKAFKQMKDYIISSNSLSTTNELIKLTSTVNKHDRDLKTIKSKLSKVMDNFIDPSTYKHFLILNGEKIEADIAYQTIYQLAKKSIILVDDYIGIKTLLHLKAANKDVNITIITDNKAAPKLEDAFIDDFKNNVNQSLTILPNNNKFHDRYIFIDHRTDNETIYHCGASSKDAGNRITTINKLDDKATYIDLISSLFL